MAMMGIYKDKQEGKLCWEGESVSGAVVMLLIYAYFPP
jgi:hypothetical protein